MWSNLGGGWQAYCTRTDTAVHHQGWKGSYWSSSSLCNLTRAPSDAQGRSRRPQQCPPSGQVSACARLLGGPHHRHLWQMAAPRPQPIPHKNYINLNKAGKGKKKKRRKTNQDHFRAVQIGGSAGCRSNQLMQLSWRPAVDHLPGSRVAVVAVSAGLAPRRAGPRGREGAICPAPGCSCRTPRGTAREPARCPGPPGTAT